MSSDTVGLIKHREILFAALQPEPKPAHTAVLLLSDVTGIIHLHPHSDLRLQVGYDIQRVCLQAIEEALIEVGFHLDNSLLPKLKRALYYYTEEVQQENLGCGRGGSNCTQKVFINRYQRMAHGCRDDRPDHWRKYL